MEANGLTTLRMAEEGELKAQCLLPQANNKLKEPVNKNNGHGRTAHNMSSSSLRKKSDLSLVAKIRPRPLRSLLANLQEIFLGTKLFVLFPAVPLAIAAHFYGFGRAWVFALSLLGLTPLAERVSFLTEQIAFYTGPTVGGLLNATCGNATELIIALFALRGSKIELVKWSLVGSVLSNLLLVLGTSLLCGGVANLNQQQLFDRRQADVNSGLLLLAALCHTLPLLFRYAAAQSPETGSNDESVVLTMSRACSIVMLVAYTAYLFFQLKTHRQLFEAQDNDQEEDEIFNDSVTTAVNEDDQPVMGFPGAMVWLIGMTIVIAVLSEFVVQTIEAASESWNLSVSFISIILLPIVGNAAEHAGAIIFAYKNKLDITLGVSLGSATQISMFVIPLTVIVSWIMGMKMDLNFNVLETASLLLAILVTTFALQDGTSHYLKGCILLLCYIVIGACFFVLHTPSRGNGLKLGASATANGFKTA